MLPGKVPSIIPSLIPIESMKKNIEYKNVELFTFFVIEEKF